MKSREKSPSTIDRPVIRAHDWNSQQTKDKESEMLCNDTQNFSFSAWFFQSQDKLIYDTKFGKQSVESTPVSLPTPLAE